MVTTVTESPDNFIVLHLDASNVFRIAFREVVGSIPNVRVISASNVHDALSLISRTRVDIAIVDRLGLLIANRLREEAPDIPVVFLSALSKSEALLDDDTLPPVAEWIEKRFDWPTRINSLIALHATSLPRLFKGCVLLNCAIVNYGEKHEEGQLIGSVALPWFEILREIERDENFIYTFAQQPRKFEEFIAGAYERSGWRDIVITPQSGDRGRDIIVSATLPGIGTVQVVDELKAYSPNRPVTAKEVSRLAWVLQRDQAVSKGIVTTTSNFAPGVYSEFSELLGGRLELKDGNSLRNWLLTLAST